MNRFWHIFLLVPVIILVGLFGIVQFAVSENIDVGMTITANCGNGIVDTGEECDDGNTVSGDDCSATCQTENTNIIPPCADSIGPSISVISVEISGTNVSIKWSATDVSGITSQSFGYGIGNYNSSGSINSLGGGQYQVNLSGLINFSTYSYRIMATDGAATLPRCSANTSQFSGSFNITGNDLTSPIISNIQITPGITNANVSWQTNENTSAQINYGFTTAYGATYTSTDLSTNHQVVLGSATPCLVPNRSYHLQILATDASGNSTASEDYSFTTLPDDDPPPPASNFNVVADNNALVITWINPNLTGCPSDMAGIKILRKLGTYSQDQNDGIVVYNGTGVSFIDRNVAFETTYFYTGFVYDTSGNYSTGVFDSGLVEPSFTEEQVCDNGLDDDQDGLIDCADDDCFGRLGCTQCSDGIDNDGDELIDLADPGCNGDFYDDNEFHIPTTEEPECGNGVKEDGEDCDDGDQNGLCPASCSLSCRINNCGNHDGGVAQCADGLDNDGDGLIDLADPGCGSVSDNEEYNSPASALPVLEFEGLLFRAGNRNIELVARDGKVSSLAGTYFSVLIPDDNIMGFPDSLILKFRGDQYIFEHDDGFYVADITIP